MGDPGSIPGSGRSLGAGIGYPLQFSWASLVAQIANNPPATWETWFWSLGWEDPLRKEQLPTPVFLPEESHGQRSLAGYSPRGCKESDTTVQLSLSLTFILEKGKQEEDVGSRRRWATLSRREAPRCQWCGLESGSRLGGWGWGTPAGHSSRRRIWLDRTDTGEGSGGEDVNKANP